MLKQTDLDRFIGDWQCVLCFQRLVFNRSHPYHTCVYLYSERFFFFFIFFLLSQHSFHTPYSFLLNSFSLNTHCHSLSLCSMKCRFLWTESSWSACEVWCEIWSLMIETGLLAFSSFRWFEFTFSSLFLLFPSVTLCHFLGVASIFFSSQPYIILSHVANRVI